MIYDALDTPYGSDGEHSNAPKSRTPEQPDPVSPLSNPLFSEMKLPALAAQCSMEIDHYRQGELYTDSYSVELLRRATVANDQEAWACVQHCFSGLVRGWLHRHPKRAIACHLENEEHYVAQAFERFWQATASTQQVEFRTFAAALQYLRASVHGAILDTLRTYHRPVEVSRPVSGALGESSMEDVMCGSELWDILKGLFSNPREQRLAYLLFHCGLLPREIVHYCSPEWSSVQEIYRLRRTILERVLRHADTLRWRLS
jgi:hypothetical protein